MKTFDKKETAFNTRVKLVTSYNIPDPPSSSIFVYHSITDYNIFSFIQKEINYRRSGRHSEVQKQSFTDVLQTGSS